MQNDDQNEPKQFIVHRIPSIFVIFDLLEAFDRQWGINVLDKKNVAERRNLIVHLGDELRRLGARKIFVGKTPYWTTLISKESLAKALEAYPKNLYFEVEWLGREKTHFDLSVAADREKYVQSAYRNDIFDEILEIFC